MTSTVADIIKDSMRVIGALAKSETPDSAEMTENLRALNLMLGSASMKKLMLRGDISTTHTLSASTGSYTIGTTGTIATAKPLKITYAYISDSDSNTYPLEIIERDQYFSFNDRLTASNRPTHLYYDPGNTQQTNQVGTIYLYPIPTTAETLTIFQWKALTDFDALTTVVNLESIYHEAIKYSLAIRLWPEYHGYTVPVPDVIVALASDNIKSLEDFNATIPLATCDLTTEAPYDIYNG